MTLLFTLQIRTPAPSTLAKMAERALSKETIIAAYVSQNGKEKIAQKVRNV